MTDDADAIVAFDFDQTLTTPCNRVLTLRGGDETLAALRSLHERGVPMLIITAASVTPTSVLSVADEARRLGIAEMFYVDEVEMDLILDHVETMGDNSA